MSTDQQEAAASYQALQQNLYEAPTLLYQGLPSNPCDPYSCLWPFTNAMAGTVYLAAGPGGRGYTTDVLARTLGLLSYADLHETSPTGTSQTPAFQSAVAPPRGPGGNTYYDDNAWAALDLIAAYRLTGSNIDLFVAQALFNFVLTGWDTSQTDGCPGGVLWEDVSGSQRNTTANAANAEVGLELYQLTKNVTDLFGAAVMYQWVNTCLKSPDDLYYDHVNPGGTVNTTIWSYNQGTMVGAGVLLYQITGNAGFLTSAQATAEAAVAYVFHLSGPLAATSPSSWTEGPEWSRRFPWPTSRSGRTRSPSSSSLAAASTPKNRSISGPSIGAAMPKSGNERRAISDLPCEVPTDLRRALGRLQHRCPQKSLDVSH